LVLGQTSFYWLEAVAGTVRPVVALETVFEVVVKVVAALETIVEEMGLQSCPPMHLHCPQHYDVLGYDELD